MAKSKKVIIEGNTISGAAEDILDVLQNATNRLAEEAQSEKTVDIRTAKLKDVFCNYSYELLTGPTSGDAIGRNGASVIHDDLRNAFAKLNPHLAVICEQIPAEEFDEIDSIAKYDDEVHLARSLEHKVNHYSVSGFILDGTGEKESIVLLGEKRLPMAIMFSSKHRNDISMAVTFLFKSCVLLSMI